MQPEKLVLQSVECLEPARWRARIQFPNRPQPAVVLVFERDGRYAGMRAHCPHKGQDLSQCPLDTADRLACPRHGAVMYSWGKDGFRIEREADRFVVSWPLEQLP